MIRENIIPVANRAIEARRAFTELSRYLEWAEQTLTNGALTLDASDKQAMLTNGQAQLDTAVAAGQAVVTAWNATDPIEE